LLMVVGVDLVVETATENVDLKLKNLQTTQ
jgi:hypothetical protein